MTARGTIASGAALAGLVAAAWAAVVWEGRLMAPQPGVAAFLPSWTLMMAAMMLPSAAPLVLSYRKGGESFGRMALLVAGYLAVWAAVGIPALALHTVSDPVPAAVAAVLVAAGIYQLSPLKSVCLRRCRSPLAFLLQHWKGGRLGAVELRVRHGAWCTGCCGALMVVLVAAGGMALVWVAAIALAVFAEKVLPGGELTAQAGGAALVGLGIAVAARPELATSLSM